MRMDQSFKDMESMFKRNFPKQTKGKDRAAIREIMREMGYGYGTGLNKEMRKNKGVSKFKDGGLAMAIEKVKAKGMELGGDVPMPKSKPNSLKADKTEILNEDFSKKVAKTNEKNKKLIGNQKKLDKNKDGTISGADFKMMEYGGKVQKMKYGGVAKGGKMGCRGMGAAIKGGGFSIR